MGKGKENKRMKQVRKMFSAPDGVERLNVDEDIAVFGENLVVMKNKRSKFHYTLVVSPEGRFAVHSTLEGPEKKHFPRFSYDPTKVTYVEQERIIAESSRLAITDDPLMASLIVVVPPEADEVLQEIWKVKGKTADYDEGAMEELKTKLRTFDVKGFASSGFTYGWALWKGNLVGLLTRHEDGFIWFCDWEKLMDKYLEAAGEQRF